VAVFVHEEEGDRELFVAAVPCPLSVNGVADFSADIPTHTAPLPETFILRIYYQDGSNRTYKTTLNLWRGDDLILTALSYGMQRSTTAETVSALRQRSRSH
jgi:hypothetical protein